MEAMAAFAVEHERIVVKPNFITADVTPGEGRGEYAIFVGRLSEEKGIGVLLKAWQTLRSPIPFGPFMAAGAVVALALQPALR